MRLVHFQEGYSQAWMYVAMDYSELADEQVQLFQDEIIKQDIPSSFIHCTPFGLGAFREKIRREGGTVFALNMMP